MFPLSMARLALTMLALVIALAGVEFVMASLGLDDQSQQFASTVLLVGLISVWPWVGAKLIRLLIDERKLINEEIGLSRLTSAVSAVKPDRVADPRVIIFDSQKTNAITFGTRGSSIIACSSGNLRSLNDNELKALFAHELAHVDAGHSIQMFGVLASLFFAKALFGGFGLPISMFVLLMYLYLLRSNELEADARAAKTVGVENMSRFLKKLKVLTNAGRWSETSIAEVVSTHPTFKRRIDRMV